MARSKARMAELIDGCIARAFCVLQTAGAKASRSRLHPIATKQFPCRSQPFEMTAQHRRIRRRIMRVRPLVTLPRCNSCTAVQFLPRCGASAKRQTADDSGLCARHGYCPHHSRWHRSQLIPFAASHHQGALDGTNEKYTHACPRICRQRCRVETRAPRQECRRDGARFQTATFWRRNNVDAQQGAQRRAYRAERADYASHPERIRSGQPGSRVGRQTIARWASRRENRRGNGRSFEAAWWHGRYVFRRRRRPGRSGAVKGDVA